MRDYLTQILAIYEAQYDERLTANAFRLFMDSNTELASRANLAGHVTGSALVWHRATDRVLRVHHAKLNCLVYSAGGHIDPDETPWQCATRELREETGILATPLFGNGTQPMPLVLGCHPIHASIAKGEPAHWHYDMVYLFEVTDIPDLAADPAEIISVVWMPVDQVNATTNSPVDLRQQMRRNGL